MSRPAPEASGSGGASTIDPVVDGSAAGAAGDSQGRPVLELRSLSKAFGAVRALTDVSLRLRPSRVTALVGDNGAGKSTLVKCMSGVLHPDSGQILLDGDPVRIADPLEARDLGIETVPQNLMLVDTMDVSANLFLHREIRRSNPLLARLGLLDKAAMRREAGEILDRLHINIPSVTQPIETLSGGQRQAIAVGRAVAWGRRVVLMDEPSAALGVEQTRLVLDLIRKLAQRGVAVLLISHNMQQVIDVADDVIVLRHGSVVGEVATDQVTGSDLVDLITGVDRGVGAIDHDTAPPADGQLRELSRLRTEVTQLRQENARLRTSVPPAGEEGADGG